jgi:glycosyltransferase involved in cell wall biosynthesis
MISVLILTLNEENDIAACLKSVAWCDDIHVFDSYSTDKTVEIARNAGASIMQRTFEGYASQRNAALISCQFRHSWVLLLDADERIPDLLAREMLDSVAKAETSISAFRLRRRDFLFGKWLKHSQLTSFYTRLIRPKCARYEREVNEVLRIKGQIAELAEPFDHFPFSKGVSHWIEKHNNYSSMEAIRWIEEQEGREIFNLSKALFSKDISERRFHQKGIFYKLPARPLIKWLYMIFCRWSFLDGSAGLTYASLQAVYEYLIVIKARELMVNKKSNTNTSRLRTVLRKEK